MSKLGTGCSGDGRMIFSCQEMLAICRKNDLNGNKSIAEKAMLDIFCYLFHFNRLNDVNICSLRVRILRMRVQISLLVNFIYYEPYITAVKYQNDLNVAIKSRKEEKLVKINQ